MRCVLDLLSAIVGVHRPTVSATRSSVEQTLTQQEERMM